MDGVRNKWTWRGCQLKMIGNRRTDFKRKIATISLICIKMNWLTCLQRQSYTSRTLAIQFTHTDNDPTNRRLTADALCPPDRQFYIRCCLCKPVGGVPHKSKYLCSLRVAEKKATDRIIKILSKAGENRISHFISAAMILAAAMLAPSSSSTQ